MNAPDFPATGRTNVGCDSKPLATCAPGPMHGVVNSVHGPQIESATLRRTMLGDQPVHSELNSQ